MYKLVAVDLDGTMLNSYGIVTENTKNVIKKVIEQGTEVIIASGRPIDSIKTIAKEIGSNNYFIAGNGALIYDIKNEKTIYEKYITKQKVLEIIKICEENTTIHLADGSTISLFNGSCIDVIFDTNGNVPPNESARDQFRFLFCLNKTDQIGHCGKENKVFCTYGLNNTSSRATILNTCKTNTAYCSRLLQIDGWEFKKDYPHRL